MLTERLIELLPYALTEDEDSRYALEGMLGPVGLVDDYLDARTRKLSNLLDPSTCPDTVVAHLAAIVGVGLDLGAANAASTAELRKLIPVAVSLWKVKGTRWSWRSICAALAGSRALILDWFYLRTVTGNPARVHVLPGPGGAVGSSYDYPEHVTDLWIHDPDGNAPIALLARFLDVLRGVGERINLRAANMVDDLGAGAAKWTGSGAGSSSYDAATWELSTLGIYELEADLDGLEDTWSDYRATFRLRVTAAGVLRFYYESAALHYHVAIDQVANTVELFRVIGGVPTSVGVASTSIVGAFDYMWSVEVWEAAGTVIKVIKDGLVLIQITDNTVGRPAQGPVRFGGTAGPSNYTLSAFLLWERGITTTRVGPNP